MFSSPQRWSLGSGGKHVMDSVSQCEHAVGGQQDSEEERAPWQLWVRKETFLPWHDCADDPVSTDLIYRQVLLGIKAEEYVCEKVRRPAARFPPETVLCFVKE